MIIDIRGTHGAGKSSLVRSLLNSADSVMTHPRAGTEEIMGYQALFGKVRVGVVGRYTTDCGGCDTIKTQEDVCVRVREFSHNYDHVVYEGALVTTLWSRYRDLALELGPRRFLFAFMDTPLQTCIDRVNARRAGSGKEPLADPKNIRDKYATASRIMQKCIDEGMQWRLIDHTHPEKTLGDLLDISIERRL